MAAKITRAIGPSHYIKGWHNTVTIGVFSCATAAGVLAGLDANQLRVAWGIAASQATGVRRNFGTMIKPFHAGQAARSGIEAAWLAGHGATADMDIFDGKLGYLSVYGGPGGEPLAELVDGMGPPWEAIEPGLYNKRWPCCGQIHRSLVGAGALAHEHGIAPGEIERIRIGFAPGADAALIYDNPQSGLEGRFSVQYSVASYLVDGKLTLASYEDECLRRPAVRALMARVERYVTDDPKKDYDGLGGYTDVVIDTARGTFARASRLTTTGRHASSPTPSTTRNSSIA